MAREIKVVAEAGLLHTIEVDMKEGKEIRKIRYDRVKSPDAFKSYIASATGDTLSGAYAMYCYGVDLKARGSQREPVVAETTVVRIKGKEIDLMSFPPEKLIPFLNAKHAAFEADRLLNPEAKYAVAFATATKQLLADGKAKQGPNGSLVLAAKK